MYTEDYNDSNYSLRSLILKVFLILTIIIILIWIVPKFLSYKKKDTQTKEKTVISAKISNKEINNLEQAGLKYFNNNNIPTDNNTSKKVTLKELKENNVVGNIKNGNTVCDINKSYVKLTKTENDYTMKSYLRCASSTKYSIKHINKYDYCKDTTLCEKQNIEESTPIEDNKNKESKIDDNKEKPKTLSEFSKWEDYTKTSCDTKEITCDINDTNCLKEVKIYTRKEIVGTKTTPLSTEHTALKYINTQQKTVCNNYNYIVISNVIFRTQGNYDEILSLGKTSTNSWTYRGQISTDTTPSFGGNEYYKYVGTKDNIHYYDSYKYNYSMERVTSYTSGCNNTAVKKVNFYNVYKQKETYNIEENVYATACYQSTRTRTYN